MEQLLLNRFRDIQVSINNLYGDPFFPSQVENTFSKLNRLVETKHTGIVSIITKTEIKEDIAKHLSYFSTKLKLVLLVSVSNLPDFIEPIKGNRFKTLALCKQFNIPAIAYVRPFIPPYNTTEEIILDLFTKIKNTGINTCVISGLRGDDEIFSRLNISDEEKKKWSYRVKIIPSDIRKYLDKAITATGILAFERTSCAVSYVLGDSFSYNPYYSAPQLAKCKECPLKSTCFDNQKNFIPTEEDLALVHYLGYDAEIINPSTIEMCHVNPVKRTECRSCCTSCYMLKRPSIRILNKNVNLGDISLLRLLTRKLIYADGINDNGDVNIARPKVLKENIYMLNSWWSYSHNIKSCYGCSYCIVTHYDNANCEISAAPYDVAKRILEVKE